MAAFCLFPNITNKNTKKIVYLLEERKTIIVHEISVRYIIQWNSVLYRNKQKPFGFLHLILCGKLQVGHYALDHLFQKLMHIV